MPSINGNQRTKRDRSEEVEEGPSQRARSTVRQAIDQAKAAAAKEDFQKATDIYDDALNQDELSKSSRLQLLLNRSSMHRKAGNTQAALKDSRAAVNLDLRSAHAYISAAKSLHLAGHKGKAKQALSTAANLNADKDEAIGSVIEKLRKEWRSIDLLRLADDILMEVFSYLDTPDLCSLKATCKNLNVFLRHNPSLWGHQVILKGSLAKIVRQWRRLSNLLACREVYSIHMTLTTVAITRIDLMAFYKSLPLANLRIFVYHSQVREPYDRDLWQEVVKNCRRLRILRFSSFDCNVYAPMLKPQDCLASCQLKVLSLEGIHFNTPEAVERESFCKLVGDAKEIRIAATMSKLEVQAIVEAAKDSVETLHIDVSVPVYHNEADDMPPEAAIVLSKAHSVDLNWKCTKAMMDYRAPLAKKLVLKCSYGIDEIRLQMHMKALLQSCARNLISLEVVANCELAASILNDELPNLQLCESLSFTLTSESTLPRLWTPDAVQEGQIASQMSKGLLPSLRCMKIVGDTTLKGGEVATFLRSRKIAGATSIERLELINCENVGSEAVAWMRRYIPHFIIRADRKH